jgi:hypothetical protein
MRTFLAARCTRCSLVLFMGSMSKPVSCRLSESLARCASLRGFRTLSASCPFVHHYIPPRALRFSQPICKAIIYLLGASGEREFYLRRSSKMGQQGWEVQACRSNMVTSSLVSGSLASSRSQCLNVQSKAERARQKVRKLCCNSNRS